MGEIASPGLSSKASPAEPLAAADRRSALPPFLLALAVATLTVAAGLLVYAASQWAGTHAALDHARVVVYAGCGVSVLAAALCVPGLLRDSWHRWVAASALLPPVGVFVVGARLLVAPHEGGLFDAIIRGDEVGVRRALAWGASAEARRPWQASDASEGASALTTAARAGRVPVVQLLLDRGADPDRPDGFGDLPVHRAAGAGHAQVVALLISHGADPKRLDGRGDTALHWAAGMAQSDAIDRLIDLGADVDAPGYRGATPLHRVVRTRDVTAATRLLNRGADRSVRDDDGRTPLDIARKELADRTRFMKANLSPEAFARWSPAPLRGMIDLLEKWDEQSPTSEN